MYTAPRATASEMLGGERLDAGAGSRGVTPAVSITTSVPPSRPCWTARDGLVALSGAHDPDVLALEQLLEVTAPIVAAERDDARGERRPLGVGRGQRRGAPGLAGAAGADEGDCGTGGGQRSRRGDDRGEHRPDAVAQGALRERRAVRGCGDDQLVRPGIADALRGQLLRDRVGLVRIKPTGLLGDPRVGRRGNRGGRGCDRRGIRGQAGPRRPERSGLDDRRRCLGDDRLWRGRSDRPSGDRGRRPGKRSGLEDDRLEDDRLGDDRLGGLGVVRSRRQPFCRWSRA